MQSIRQTKQEPSDRPRLKDMLQNNWPVRFKNVGGHGSRRVETVPAPTDGRRAKRNWPVHAREEHSALRRKEILAGMEDTVLRDMSRSQEDRRRVMPLVCGPQKSQGHGDREQAVGTAGRRRRGVVQWGRSCSWGRRFRRRWWGQWQSEAHVLDAPPPHG